MKSLLLDRTAWDCVLDAAGNWAVCSEPYAVAQDVACAWKLFRGELWYQKNKGLPYFEEIMGELPPESLLRSYYDDAALAVPLVERVQVTFTRFQNRKLEGQGLIIDVNGSKSGVSF